MGVASMANAATKLMCNSCRQALKVYSADKMGPHDWIKVLQSSLGKKLAEASVRLSAMLKDILKIIFAPAELIPNVGKAIHQVLDSVAGYAANYIEGRFRYWFEEAVDEIMS